MCPVPEWNDETETSLLDLLNEGQIWIDAKPPEEELVARLKLIIRDMQRILECGGN